MRFQNVKAEELEGPVKIPGYQEWARGITPNAGVTSLLLTGAPGTGKGSAIGNLAETLHYDIVRCRLKQLLEYPNPDSEFRAMLEGAEHLHRTIIWLDGLDGLLSRLKEGAAALQEFLAQWLTSEHDFLRRNEVLLAATIREPAAASAALTAAFDKTFTA